MKFNCDLILTGVGSVDSYETNVVSFETNTKWPKKLSVTLNKPSDSHKQILRMIWSCMAKSEKDRLCLVKHWMPGVEQIAVEIPNHHAFAIAHRYFRNSILPRFSHSCTTPGWRMRRLIYIHGIAPTNTDEQFSMGSCGALVRAKQSCQMQRQWWARTRSTTTALWE